VTAVVLSLPVEAVRYMECIFSDHTNFGRKIQKADVFTRNTVKAAYCVRLSRKIRQRMQSFVWPLEIDSVRARSLVQRGSRMK
jgi:hypothetical protein